VNEIVVEHLAVGPLGCNCTIVADRTAGEAIVVDAGDEVENVLATLDELGVRATVLVHTHGHIDHIGAYAEMRERTNARGLLHHGDLPLYKLAAEQARFLGMKPPKIVDLDGDLTDGDVIRAGDAKLTVLHTPGHTPGSCSFAYESGSETTLLTGDTLFAGAVGRWDLGGTSLGDIVTSIRSKLLVYEDATGVVPGHGPFTTIGRERALNPFLV
jgi:glyoxylase-like metal-dependent hydrolase (beta-lactamase superfamily II)